METEETERRVNYWQIFYDDIFLLFFLGAAIYLISYTIWGLIELSSAPLSPLV